MQGLGDLAGGPFRSQAYAVSGDGWVVVGFSQTSENSWDAFVRTVEEGMRHLHDLLEKVYDLDLAG